MMFVFLLPETIGGVLSVVNQYATYLLNECNSNTVDIILTSVKETQSKGILLDNVLPSDAKIQRFIYSKYDNRNAVYLKLSLLIPSKDAVLICNDCLELYMIANLRLPNPCYLILHGDYDYYYNLAESCKGFIHHFFAVNPIIQNKISETIKHKSVSTLKFLLGNNKVEMSKFSDSTLRIIFIGRVHYSKGFDILMQIYHNLKEIKFPFLLTIIGSLQDEKYRDFLSIEGVRYISQLDNKQVQELLAAHHVFLLPSRAEGYPVTIVEAMKAGVIPVVNDIPAMAPDILFEKETGFRIPENKIEIYCEKLIEIYQNRILMQNISLNAFNKAMVCFDNDTNFNNFLNTINSTLVCTTPKNFPVGIGMSFLDKVYFPNQLTFLLRLIRQKFRYGR
jgi:glycosyltransferase involved in cell wall biosynthesis